MYIKAFTFCDDCSKQEECDQRFSPGCDNPLGYVYTKKDKEKRNEIHN